MVQQEAATGTAFFPIDASSVGLGDIGVTGQYRLWAGANVPDGLTARITLRAPTGNADELRGVDTWRAMASATASRGFGRVSVHGTAGYESWSSSVTLRNTLPANVVETWLLKDQLQVGGGLELAASSIVTVSFEALWRRVGQTGQLGLRSVDAPAPGVGIESAQLLGVGLGGPREDHHGPRDQCQHSGPHDVDVSNHHLLVRLRHAGQAGSDDRAQLGRLWRLLAGFEPAHARLVGQRQHPRV